MARKDRLLLAHERCRFLATVDSVPEEAVEGVLADWDETHYIFADAYHIAANGDRLKADNEVWLPRPRVKYLQRTT